MVIYKIVSPKGKVYIGRASDFNRRMTEHKSTATKKYSSKYQYALYRAIRKYGWDNFTKEILIETDDEQLLKKLEEEFILAYDAVKKGYNDTYTGGGGDPWVGRRDTKEYMEWITHMKSVTSGENNGMYGKTHRADTLDKLKAKAKGRFTLDWYKDRNGDVDGERLYEERRVWLKNRNLKKDENGRFVKSSK